MITIFNTIHEKFHLNEETYFFVSYGKKRYIISDKCPHRGGPLSLGKICEKSATIKCPWHESKFKIPLLIKKSLVALRIKDTLLVYNTGGLSS